MIGFGYMVCRTYPRFPLEQVGLVAVYFDGEAADQHADKANDKFKELKRLRNPSRMVAWRNEFDPTFRPSRFSGDNDLKYVVQKCLMVRHVDEFLEEAATIWEREAAS